MAGVAHINNNEVTSAILSSCGPSLLSRSLLGQVGIFKNRPSPCSVAYSALKSQFLLLQRHANKLEIQNGILRQQHIATRAEISLLGDELQNSRVKLYEGTEQRRKDAARIKEADHRIENLRGKLQRYGDFIQILAGISLDNPLYRAALSVLSNVEAENALVTAIVEAAKDKTSPWARIIPAVSGPRRPENYVSALNLTLRTRKDLRQRGRACEFWKTMAKMDPENSNTLTPSSSAPSDVDYDRDAEVECRKSPTVVDDMLECLKNDTSFTCADSTLHTVPRPTLEDISWTEWTNTAKEEIHTGLKRLAASADALGITHNVDAPSRELKPTSHRIVRLKLNQDAINRTSVSQSDVLSSNSSVPSKNQRDKIKLKLGVNALDELIASAANILNAVETEPYPVPLLTAGVNEETFQSISTSLNLISDTLVPDSEFDENSYAEGDSSENIPPIEEIFIVKAGEDIPQLSIQLVMDHPRGHIPFSFLDSGVSSGSEYSEMSSFNQEESEHLVPTNSVEIEDIASRSSTQNPDGDQIKRKPLGAAQAFEPIRLEPTSFIGGATAINMPTGQFDKNSSHIKSPSSRTFSVKLPPSLPKPVLHPSTGDTAPRLAARLSRECSETQRGTSSSPIDCRKLLPSSPQKKPCCSAPGDAVAVPLVSQKQPIPTSKIVAPIKPIQPPTHRNNLLIPPAKFEKRPLNSPQSAVRRNSPVELPKSLKSARPILTLPRTNTINLPDLQKIDLNLSPTPEKIKSSALMDCFSNSTKPSAKDLGKRRGVIMMEKLDLMPATPPAPKVITNATIVPTTCQIKLHDPPIFCPSASGDNMNSEDQPSQSSTAVDPKTTSKGNRSHVKIVGDSTSKSSALASSNGKSTGNPLPAGKSIDKLDLSVLNSQISELVTSMSDSDLGSLEMTEESASDGEDRVDVMDIRRVRKGKWEDFSGSLNALPAFCRTLMKDTPGTFGKDRIDDDSKEDKDNPFGDDVQSASSQVKPTRFATPSLISATFGSGRRQSATSSSSTSSGPSSDFSFSLDSPTKSSSNRPLFGHTRRSPRSANISSRPAKGPNAKVAQAELPPAVQAGSPSSTCTKQTSTKPNNPSSRLNNSTSAANISSTSIPQKRTAGKENQATSSNSNSPKPTSSTSNEKSSRLPARSKATASPEQELPLSSVHPTPECRLWTGQNIFERLSNSGSKVRPNPDVSFTAKSSARSYLKLNNNSPSQLKPRANTINTPVSSPHSSTSRSLARPSPSTKPRSNTVNTYSPVNRSPLSQHVMNNSHEFQSRSNNPNSSPPRLDLSSTQRTSIQKLATASKLAQSISKSITPLRVTKKGAMTSSQPSCSRQTGPAPPTAAFMLPHKPISSSGRRPGSSVAPLIPNCPTSSNGVISPSQCRSLLRNGLSMVR